MDYKLKYLKIKKKYLDLKFLQNGGVSKKINKNNFDDNSSEQKNFPSIYKNIGINDINAIKQKNNLGFNDWLMLLKINDIIYDIEKNKNKQIINDNYTPKLIKYNDNSFLVSDEYIDDITDYFHKKVLKWMKEDHEFINVKKHIRFIKTVEGYSFIRKILKVYVRETRKSWYDLRNKANYDDIKEHIRLKLKSI